MTEPYDEGTKGRPTLEIKFESELDFPRIVRIISCASYLSEVRGVREVPTRGQSKIRCIGEIEKLGAELKMRPFRSPDLLEKREIEAMEGRSCDLSRCAPQRRKIGLPGHRRHWWIRKCCRIQELIRPVVPAA